MQSWFKDGFLPLDLPVRREGDPSFVLLRDLREGDIVTMQYVTGETARYRVSYFETVRFDRFAYPLDPRRPLLALTTCFPFGGTEYGGPWRRVAWAEEV